MVANLAIQKGRGGVSVGMERCVCAWTDAHKALHSVIVSNSPVKTLCALTAMSAHTINLPHVKTTVHTSVRSVS